MDAVKFKAVYGKSRNGINERIRHPLARNFVYSDGVRDCAEQGMYWLLDIIGTECGAVMRDYADHFEGMGFVVVKAHLGQAVITLARDDDEKPKWRKNIYLTDMPDGKWTFYLTDEGDHFFLILPSEY